MPPPERNAHPTVTFRFDLISTRQDSWGGGQFCSFFQDVILIGWLYLPGRIAGGGRSFLTHFIWMASISEGIGAMEMLVPWIC